MNSRSDLATRELYMILGLVAASVAVAYALGLGAGAGPESGAVLAAFAVPTLLAPLFWPREGESIRQLLACVIAPVATAALLVMMGLVAFGRSVPAASLLPAGLVALVILVVARLGAALVARGLGRFGASTKVAREWAMWTVTTMLWLASAGPLWLGPIADLGARSRPAIPSIILACSPLAHLAAASGYDLLRSQWFYGHSSLGALQVEYPRVATLLVGYAIAGSVLALLTIPFGHRPKDTPAVEPRIAQGERRS